MNDLEERKAGNVETKGLFVLDQKITWECVSNRVEDDVNAKILGY